jgi:hypothetical protein
MQRLAPSSGLSMSVHLKTLGLAHEPKSVLDAERVGDLLKACGDLGRLGGLLKLWLVEKPGQGASADEVRHLLEQIQAAREAIVDKVAAIWLPRRPAGLPAVPSGDWRLMCPISRGSPICATGGARPITSWTA